MDLNLNQLKYIRGVLSLKRCYKPYEERGDTNVPKGILWNDDVERLQIGNIINISGAHIIFNTWNNQLQIKLGYVDGSFQVAFNSKIELDEWKKKLKEEEKKLKEEIINRNRRNSILERERILEKKKLRRVPYDQK